MRDDLSQCNAYILFRSNLIDKHTKLYSVTASNNRSPDIITLLLFVRTTYK